VWSSRLGGVGRGGVASPELQHQAADGVRLVQLPVERQALAAVVRAPLGRLVPAPIPCDTTQTAAVMRNAHAAQRRCDNDCVVLVQARDLTPTTRGEAGARTTPAPNPAARPTPPPPSAPRVVHSRHAARDDGAGVAARRLDEPLHAGHLAAAVQRLVDARLTDLRRGVGGGGELCTPRRDVPPPRPLGAAAGRTMAAARSSVYPSDGASASGGCVSEPASLRPSLASRASCTGGGGHVRRAHTRAATLRGRRRGRRNASGISHAPPPPRGTYLRLVPGASVWRAPRQRVALAIQEQRVADPAGGGGGWVACR
jgi:hypothetical protein